MFGVNRVEAKKKIDWQGRDMLCRSLNSAIEIAGHLDKSLDGINAMYTAFDVSIPPQIGAIQKNNRDCGQILASLRDSLRNLNHE